VFLQTNTTLLISVGLRLHRSPSLFLVQRHAQSDTWGPALSKRECTPEGVVLKLHLQLSSVIPLQANNNGTRQSVEMKEATGQQKQQAAQVHKQQIKQVQKHRAEQVQKQQLNKWYPG
jgi:hypothetical protein